MADEKSSQFVDLSDTFKGMAAGIPHSVEMSVGAVYRVREDYSYQQEIKCRKDDLLLCVDRIGSGAHATHYFLPLKKAPDGYEKISDNSFELPTGRCALRLVEVLPIECKVNLRPKTP